MKKDYKQLINDLYEKKNNEYYLHNQYSTTKLEFIGNHIFDFITYDGNMDEILATKMLLVCEHILNGTNFEYIKAPEDYLDYMTMVNMPFLQNKLEWGTSIRGAWFDDSDNTNNFGIDNGNNIIPKSDLKVFIKDLIEWSKEQ